MISLDLVKNSINNTSTYNVLTPIFVFSPLSGDGAVHEGSTEPTTPEVDPSKCKLLEALCHSQPRAREAEKAAKQAYEEKEHVVKLIFKQASQLFAYKQWLYLLQLENIYNQIKTNKITPHDQISALAPS